jgi:hypothetical protein
MAELSDYERRRLENIKRNEAFLASLGLDSIKPVIEKPTKTKDIQERKKAAARQAQSEGPSRRSSRIAGIKTSVVHEEDEDEDKDGEDEDDAVDYDQMPSEPWQLDDAEFQVLVRLKQWRLLKCRELETEAYKIFQNRTLSEAVRRRRNVPTFGAEDIVAWTEIWGIGPGKTSSEPRGFAWDLRDELDRPEALELLKKSRLSGAHIQVKGK